MGQVIASGWYVQNESLMAGREIGIHFGRDLPITAHQIGTEGLVVLKGRQPVSRARNVLAKLGKLTMPHGVGDFHRQLVRDLAGSVRREAFIRDLPGVVFVWPRDDANANPCPRLSGT